ncbi:MAG: ArgE/DapE family deacylase [Acidimicrobiia bacterium]
MNDRTADILEAVDAGFDDEVQFIADLVRFPSTRGNEEDAQRFMADAFELRGYAVDVWKVNVDDISSLPGFSPVDVSYENAFNVVATSRSRRSTGRSLILNGHVDVVPEGPHGMWETPPYEPRREGQWMYGRGIGDMKSGLVANMFALDALRNLGCRPAADVFVQSVIEEECTGNGTLACLQRGYEAEAALIPEPFDEQLIQAQVGVVWFKIRLKGVPVHVLEAGSGFNAIEAFIPLVDALHTLESTWNAPDRRNIYFADIDNPLNLNVGMIRGGDWASSVPAWCDVDLRMAVFPGQSVAQLTKEIEACLHDAAATMPYLEENPPEIVYNGFLAEGYALADDTTPAAKGAIAALETAHRAASGDDLVRLSTTATTDARFFGLNAGIPALVYGPKAERIHGLDERVDLESVRRVTGAIALFVADWCGLEPLSS